MSGRRATGRADGRLGDKLGPRLVSLLTDATVRTRRVLAGHEARVTTAALQEIIDRAGREFAALHGPYLRQVLAAKGDGMHPVMKHMLTRTASGAHQWEAIAGGLQMAASYGLSGAISNVTAPVWGEINLHDRNLGLDAQTAAMAAAAGVIGYSEGDGIAGVQGYTSSAYRMMFDLAQRPPPLPALNDLLNRGLIDGEQVTAWLKRAAIPPSLVGPLAATRWQLLSPADAALAVLRGTLTPSDGQRAARRSGVSDADFQVLLANTGEPLGLEQLLEAYRRGFIGKHDLERGIRQSRVRDEWIPTAEALRYGPVPTADAVDAALRGHLDWGEAEKIAAANGTEPSQFGVLRANAGSPPGDVQLLEMWRRGVISERQVDEGLRFGRLRDDWIVPMKGLKDEPLPTADAIDAWLRGHLGKAEAERVLEENGLMRRDWDAAFGNAGNPLALGQLLDAYRRGLIQRDRFETGFRQSRYRDEWAGLALELAYEPMSTADAISAVVQGHLTLPQAAEVAKANGLEARYVQTLYETAGEPLSRTELEQLYNRGKISLATVKQGLRESRLKDKYVDAATELHVRLPEPRQVVTALTDGAVTRERAHEILADYGYDAATIAMLITTGEIRSTGPHRELASGEVQSLYADRIITRARAEQLLEELHYTAESASVILELADYKTHQRILSSGVAAIRSHYLAGIISATVAHSDLLQLNLPQATAELYLQVWALDKLAHPKRLTEAQIVKAANKGLFTIAPTGNADSDTAAQRAEGHRRLVALGYDDTDADLLLAGA